MKKTARTGLIVLFLGLLLASCSKSSDWVQFRGAGGRGAASTRISPPLGLKWKFRLQLDGRTLHSFNPPVVKGDTIYFGSADGNFYALDIESGYMDWVFKSGAAINSVPYADSEYVYFGSQDGKAYALARDAGLEIWNFSTGRQVNSSVERYKDFIIFTSDGGESFFLNPEGERIFEIPNPVWHNHTFQMYDDVMYFAPGPLSNPRSFGPYDIKERRYLWVLENDGFNAIWYSFPAIRGDLIFFSTAGFDGFDWDLSFYAYHRLTGREVWRHQDFGRWGSSGSSVFPDLEALFLRCMDLLDFMTPSVWKDLVIYSGGDAVVRAFDAGSGAVRWEREFDRPVSSAPTVAGGRLYFGLLGTGEAGGGPQLICLSARDGKTLWRMDLEGAILSAPVIAGKRLMFGTDQSIFYIMEEVF